jgi:hypothetical protein
MAQNGLAAAPAVEAQNGQFSQRELYMAKRESDGDLAFRYVENNGLANNSIWCVLPCSCLCMLFRMSQLLQPMHNKGLKRSKHHQQAPAQHVTALE